MAFDVSIVMQWVVDDRALAELYGRRNSYMSGLRMHWMPYDCIIPAYSTEELRQALRDRTLFFYGDSTMCVLVDHFLECSVYDGRIAGK